VNIKIAEFDSALNRVYPKAIKLTMVAQALEHYLTQETLKGNEDVIRELDAACRRQTLGITKLTEKTFYLLMDKFDF